MKSRQIIKICIDLAMLVLLPLLMAYSLVGETAHEWIGIGMFVLFISHQLMNRQWYKNIWKGKLRKSLRRSVVTKVGTVIPKIFAVILSIWGISAFIRRQIGSYMFFQSQFVFFDYTEPKIYFFADYIAIMCLFAFFGYYLSRVLTYLQRKNKQ